MNKEKLKNIIEGILMTSDKPRTINQILALFEEDTDQPDKEAVRVALNQLQQDYTNRGIELKEVASGYRFQVCPDYSLWITRLFDERPPRYSRALLETLALIAYRQPITRSEIEEIRGVSINSTIIKTLQEREWIRVVGYRDVPGRPELLATTREFLDYFNLKKVSEMPPLSKIKDFEQINPDLFEGLELPMAKEESESKQSTVQDLQEENGSRTKDNVIPISG